MRLVKLFTNFIPGNNIILISPAKKITGIRLLSSYFSSFKDKELVYDPGLEEDLSLTLKKVLKDLRPGKEDKWYLGLPLQYFSIANFTLPAAASENLDQAVKFSLMRHIPYDLNQAYLSYSVEESDHGLEISGAAAQKSEIEPYLQAAREAGISLTAFFPALILGPLSAGEGIFFSGNTSHQELLVWQQEKIRLMNWQQTQKDEQYLDFFNQSASLLENTVNLPQNLYVWNSQFSAEEVQEYLGAELENNGQELKGLNAADRLYKLKYAFNLTSANMLKKRKISAAISYAGLIFCLLALLTIPFAEMLGKHSYLKKLQANIAEVQGRANELNEIRQENENLQEYVEFMAQKAERQPNVLKILKEVTEVLPKTCWISAFDFADEQIVVQGFADSATGAIEALENSILFEKVQFDSPIKKSGSKESFKIVAQVVNN